MNRTIEWILKITLALVALGFLVAGASREYKVYDIPREEYGLRSYTDISEYELVRDATFSGTVRKGDELYSTYNRAAPQGKIACPT